MIFKKLFGGGKSPLEEGNARLEKGDFSGALMAFRKAKGKTEEERVLIKEKIDMCKDGLALRRLSEARRLHGEGNEQLRDEEISGAREVAATEKTRAEIEAFVDEILAGRGGAGSIVEITAEDRFMLVAERWSDAQKEELSAYGEPLKAAILSFLSGEFEDAKEHILSLAQEAIPKTSDAPRYLWLEVARIHLALEELDETEAALARYLESTDVEEIDEPWLGAQVALAQLADKRGDFEKAMAHFSEATAAFEDDARPYLAMGEFLRERQLPEEAIDMLEAAAELSAGEPTEWLAKRELGLAQRDAGRNEAAMETLESVLAFFLKAKQVDFPPSVASALAELQEDAGNLGRAADLWATLARGSDETRHERYHREAARVLRKMGREDDAARHDKKANALSQSSEKERSQSSEEE